jgi:signal transduction histidine kinase
VTAHDTRTTGTDHGKAGFLAEASRLLAGSLDYETTLATVAGMALPHLGAWCFVDLIEPGGEMRRLAVIHPDPDKQTLARRLEGGWPPSRDDPFGVPHAMRTRESEIIREVPDDMLVEAARTEEILEMLRELGIGSLMVVPLIARDEVLGAITYVSPSGGRIYSEDDMEVAEDLAARCAVAIDNGRLYQEAERARKEAEEASQAKSLFLATMSHEIRTPINAVVGYVDLLETGIGGALSPDQVRYLERIKASNSHLLGLIDDVLDLAKADAGQIQIEQEEATMLPVVENARDMVRPQLESRTLSLSETCEGDAEARIVADVNRVRQIVINLLSNAIKFTPDGGRIRLSCGQAQRRRRGDRRGRRTLGVHPRRGHRDRDRPRIPGAPFRAVHPGRERIHPLAGGEWPRARDQPPTGAGDGRRPHGGEPARGGLHLHLVASDHVGGCAPVGPGADAGRDAPQRGQRARGAGDR